MRVPTYFEKTREPNSQGLAHLQIEHGVTIKTTKGAKNILGELSHGLTQLGVSGNRIIDTASSLPVTLRGVVRSGLEYSPLSGDGSLANAGITAADIAEIVGRWRAKIVRVPFN